MTKFIPEPDVVALLRLSSDEESIGNAPWDAFMPTL